MRISIKTQKGILMITVEIECRCGECKHWKKQKYLRHDGMCLCQVDEDDELHIYKKDTDFCSYAKKKKTRI